MASDFPRRSLLAMPLLASPLGAALRRATLASYEKYIAKQDLRAKSQNEAGKEFLWLDRNPAARAALRSGQLLSEKLGSPSAEGGLIQHWIGASYFPKATLAKVLEVDQDYDRYKIHYAPDIIDSKLLAKNGSRYEIYYRLKKKKVLTAVMDTKHQVDFIPLGTQRHAVNSRSTEVREVVDAGEATERVLPVGEGQGFLYAMNSYWRMEQSDGGVYVECEAVTLARSIPFGLGAIVGSFIESFAVESLQTTLDAKRRAVASRQ